MQRVCIFDATDTSPAPELSDAWRAAARAYRAVRRFDRIIEAHSVAQLVRELEALGNTTEVQFWGHGRPGAVFIGGEPLRPAHLREVQVRGTFWLRTCASFAGPDGKDFARELARTLRARVAGHTYNIGPIQSGLRTLESGAACAWADTEGLGKNGKPLGSLPWAPRTVTCLHADIPAGW